MNRNLILDVNDISKKQRVKQIYDPLNACSQDFFINFSNPHLGKPSWCHLNTSKVNVRSYKAGELPISQLLFPERSNDSVMQSKVNEYARNAPGEVCAQERWNSRKEAKSMQYEKGEFREPVKMLPEIRLKKRTENEGRANSIRSEALMSNTLESRRSNISAVHHFNREQDKVANMSLEVTRTVPLQNEQPVHYKKSSRHIRSGINAENGADRVPSSRRMMITPMCGLNPQNAYYGKKNIDKMY